MVQDEPSLFLISESIGRVLEKTMTILVHDQKSDRVVEQGHLRDTLFQPSSQQLEAWYEVTKAASELTSRTDPIREEADAEAFSDRLDQAAL
ncbi:hypothetical protein N7481_003423 [Penicillium waksmanii]|uniref:uncharacterized protein n=1 Tax=Penicillium waksmanii TaxID=69791 RepID=UPI002546FD81|nr:uncharacterized protein N7481_003423 [Penicillium waksmanii]KAJ5988213.1 hypothetical protein N7481_003423 [Penicillium waksmanii]